MRAGEEIRHGLGEIPYRLLLHRLRPRCQPCELLPRFSQLAALFDVAWRACPARPPMLVLFTGKIPHIPGMRAVLQQRRLLGGRGLKPEPHASTLTATTDTKEGAAFYPGLKTGTFTPRTQ
jgi:hypothetical protein